MDRSYHMSLLSLDIQDPFSVFMIAHVCEEGTWRNSLRIFSFIRHISSHLYSDSTEIKLKHELRMLNLLTYLPLLSCLLQFMRGRKGEVLFSTVRMASIKRTDIKLLFY
jgi:hypothetical protein